MHWKIGYTVEPAVRRRPLARTIGRHDHAGAQAVFEGRPTYRSSHHARVDDRMSDGLMRREGEAKGRVQALSEMLRKLAARKFGALSADDEARIADATAEQLERYVERSLAAATIDAVFGEEG